MNITLTVRHLKKSEDIKDYFNERVERLINRLSNFNKDSIFIHGTLDKNPHKQQYFAHLTVYLPSIVFNSRESAFDLFTAINSAFEAITKQTDKFKEKLRRRNRKI